VRFSSQICGERYTRAIESLGDIISDSPLRTLTSRRLLKQLCSNSLSNTKLLKLNRENGWLVLHSKPMIVARFDGNCLQGRAADKFGTTLKKFLTACFLLPLAAARSSDGISHPEIIRDLTGVLRCGLFREEFIEHSATLRRLFDYARIGIYRALRTLERVSKTCTTGPSSGKE
jgi:hypothetical protein